MAKRLILICVSALMTGCASDQNSGPSGSPLDRADPQMRAVLNELATLNPKPIETLTPAEARRQPSATDAAFQVIQAKGSSPPTGCRRWPRWTRRRSRGPGGQPLVLRVYTPPGTGPFPVVVYFHGGGWVIANLDTYDPSCRAICSMSGAVVVSVDYRKAPEYQFPAAPEDCYAALQYVTDHAAQFDGRADQVAVAGESAGGNLATDVCMLAKQRSGHMPVHQVLIYPVTDMAFDTQSYRTNADAKPLNAAMMKWFFKYYVGPNGVSGGDSQNPLLCPLRATDDQLRGLPPATVITDENRPPPRRRDRLRRASEIGRHRRRLERLRRRHPRVFRHGAGRRQSAGRRKIRRPPPRRIVRQISLPPKEK